MIFVTIGSMLPFDRMVRAMDEWAARHPEERVFFQIGGGEYEPKHGPFERMIGPGDYRKAMDEADLIVAHAGMGSVISAAEIAKPIVLLPRRIAMREHTTEHQLHTARWLRNREGVFVADSEADLEARIQEARSALIVSTELSNEAPAAFTTPLGEVISRRARSKDGFKAAGLKTRSAKATSATMRVGGVPTSRLTRAELAAKMIADCRRAAPEQLPPQVIVSSNGFVIAEFHRNQGFRDSLLAADVIDADGMPLVLATRLICNEPLRERVATTDFIHDAADAARGAGLNFYFLGAKPGVAETAAKHFREAYPGLKIVGARHGYFKPEEEAGICEEIRRLKTDVLWAGLGSPLQESFAQRNKERLRGVGWIRTCGGLFDHYSGRFKRAPQWMQTSGLEWFHRAVAEPLRLGPRYLKTNFLAAYYLATQTSDV